MLRRRGVWFSESRVNRNFTYTGVGRDKIVFPEEVTPDLRCEEQVDPWQRISHSKRRPKSFLVGPAEARLPGLVIGRPGFKT